MLNLVLISQTSQPAPLPRERPSIQDIVVVAIDLGFRSPTVPHNVKAETMLQTDSRML
jgi:hypothetical protein